MKTNHSPIPWRISYGDSAGQHTWRDSPPIIVYDDGVFGTTEIVTMPRSLNRDANAAYIVRAVNNHDALVEALNLALATIERLTVHHGPFSSTDGTTSVIRTVLAKVEP